MVFTSRPGPPEVEAGGHRGTDGLLDGHAARAQAVFDLSTNAPTRWCGGCTRPVRGDAGAHVLDSSGQWRPRRARSPRAGWRMWVGGERAELRPVPAGARGDGRPDLLRGRCRRGVGGQAGAQPARASRSARRWPRCFSHGGEGGRRPRLLLWQAVRQGASGRRRTFDALAESTSCREHYEPASLRAASSATRTCRSPPQLGREVGVPMRLANLALEEITEALGRGWGDRDSSSFMLLEEERAGGRDQGAPGAPAADPRARRAVTRARAARAARRSRPVGRLTFRADALLAEGNGDGTQ